MVFAGVADDESLNIILLIVGLALGGIWCFVYCIAITPTATSLIMTNFEPTNIFFFGPAAVSVIIGLGT
jgi:hypothetical protein